MNATRHLHNDMRGGAMIGGVVGLGKTITAYAIAKIYETTLLSSTLIICPANHQEIWPKYDGDYRLNAPCNVQVYNNYGFQGNRLHIREAYRQKTYDIYGVSVP